MLNLDFKITSNKRLGQAIWLWANSKREKLEEVRLTWIRAEKQSVQWSDPDGRQEKGQTGKKGIRWTTALGSTVSGEQKSWLYSTTMESAPRDNPWTRTNDEYKSQHWDGQSVVLWRDWEPQHYLGSWQWCKRQDQ